MSDLASWNDHVVQSHFQHTLTDTVITGELCLDEVDQYGGFVFLEIHGTPKQTHNGWYEVCILIWSQDQLFDNIETNQGEVHGYTAHQEGDLY